MDNKEPLAPSCEASSTTAPEAQCIIQMPTLKEETAECIDEEVSPCIEDMYPAELLKSPEYVNYYDSMGFEVVKFKKEIPEDEQTQSDFSINYTMVSENKELELIDKQEVNHENTEEGLSLIINEENANGNYQFIVKMEKPEEDQYLFDNAGATSLHHYDVLMNPQEVKCKLCSRIFTNGFNLLRHNIEHIKVEINTLDDNSKMMMELHQRQYVHSKKIPKGEFCGKHFKKAPNLKHSVMLLHKQISPNQVTGNSVKCKYCNVDYKHEDILYGHMEQCRTGKEVKEMKYKCDSCEGTYGSKYNLTQHIKSMHYDYGRTFDCWCGKQFRTPIQLRKHMIQQHDGKMRDANNEKVQCDTCQIKFKSKYYLLTHIKNVHYDYGKAFECWCGKQFRTPLNLRNHERWRHDGSINDTNNDKLTGKQVEELKYKCDSCAGTYRSKYSLTQHIKSMHYDYGRTFDCWCGKQFRTPLNLRNHERWVHDGSINDTNNEKLIGKQVEELKYKCGLCAGTYRSKYSLTQHIKLMHYDYGRTFDCWCGKQFRTPIQLRKHMRQQHDGKMKDTNNEKVQCDTCQIKFKSKYFLSTHIKNVHYDYGKVFDCWCGKQFRTPRNLRAHMSRQHDSKIKDRKNDKVQCDTCQRKFKSKHYLIRHIKNMHYDYGKVFECWCGKQFRTPKNLSAHMSRQHDSKTNYRNNDKLQCEA